LEQIILGERGFNFVDSGYPFSKGDNSKGKKKD
jgi:hypothetical protein